MSHRLLRFKPVWFRQDSGSDLCVATSTLFFYFFIPRSSVSSLSISSTLAKLQAVCTGTSQRNSVNNFLKKKLYLNTKWYLRVSGSLWLLCVIGSKFQTASLFLPYLLDLNSVISLVTSPFRTTCSDPDINVWIVQYSNPPVRIPWRKILFCYTFLSLVFLSVLKTAAVLNVTFVLCF